VVNGEITGRPPKLDLDKEKALISFLAEVNPMTTSAHDLSAGGLAIALAECSLAGGVGFTLDEFDADHLVMFSESPSRAIVTCNSSNTSEIIAAAERAGTAAQVIGKVGGTRMDLGLFSIALEEARMGFERALSDNLSSSIG
jgi:phosphoribosylformylglycinamidine (FGAM) synthase-like enzyme